MSENSLLQDFITETGEHLEDTERNLLRLEQDPGDAETLNDIFRSVHTIKGSSEYLGMVRIAELSHKLESLLDQLRKGERSVDGAVIDLLMGCNDRIGALVGELDQHQAEQSSIDDLVSRLQQATEQAGLETETAATEDVDGSYGEDEYDEELFGIFTDQLKEGLDGLSLDARQLVGGDDDVSILERSAERLTTLRSSSNYMGYDELKKTYEQWSQSVEQVIEALKAGNEVDLVAFAKDTMVANIDQVKALFPKVSFEAVEDDGVEEAPVSEAEPVSEEVPVSEAEPEMEISQEAPALGADQSLLQDFITETGEHLEDTERNLLRLEQDPGDVETLNDIFRSVHTIKGSSEYLGMVRIAELSHKLESLLDQLRKGERSVDGAMIDLLMNCNDRIGALVGELDQHQQEQLSVEDLLERLDLVLAEDDHASAAQGAVEKLVITDESGAVYGEEYDQELFGIFLEQLNEGLQELSNETDQLVKGEPVEVILDRCNERLNTLRSSANYMEYDDLREVYDLWLQHIAETLEKQKSGEALDIETFNKEVMHSNIERVHNFFSNLKSVVHVSEDEVVDDSETPAEKADMISKPDIDLAAEFKSFTLDDFKQDDETADLERLSKPDDDSLLLEKLASAFDSRLGFSDDVVKQSFNEHIENNLFSDEKIAASPEVDIPADSGIQKVENQDMEDVSNVESLLFSEPGFQKPEKKTTLPEPIIAAPPERAERLEPSDREAQERRTRYNLGRRQSDKFRDRMLKQSIRVDASKIDELMNQVGELVVSRSGFNQLFADMRELLLVLKQSQKLNSGEMQTIKEIANRINEATTSLGRVTSELQENVMKVRMLPIAQLFSRYPRLVHDLVRNTQKKVNLEIYGEETELDKKVIEQLADPLVHVIRNAVDHGIEDAVNRRQKGKNEIGTIRLEAFHESNYVVIEISDDGRGIDIGQVKQRAVEKEFVTAEEASEMNEEELLTLIMRPGFSTAAEVTHTSGRGVGMDVVKDNIEKLNGTIDISSRIGIGAQFRIKIPLTLAIIPALLVRVADETFTIPLSTVDETIRVQNMEISTIEGLEVYYLRENTIPLIRLKEVFNMGSDDAAQDEIFVVIVSSGAKQVGFVVDELKGRQEVVIKPLEDYLQEKSGFSGATILGDGSISLILDVFEMVQLSLEKHVSKAKITAS
ncbi:MAG: Hpt domain-containing protein [Desulfobacteraceae bacterium]